MTLANRGPMTFAGLWDVWRAPAERNGKLPKSFAIITTKSERPLATFARSHVLEPQSWAAWLGERLASPGGCAVAEPKPEPWQLRQLPLTYIV